MSGVLSAFVLGVISASSLGLGAITARFCGGFVGLAALAGFLITTLLGA